ncbi:uncharacterized protein LOC127259394 [Andrographis paniculata]|uniref:uncharacterized protein LOC127259394 n=1 Tax=Andrographis paniculata TaxID=175694 RepID=UPI0021E73A5D|nr:uncharacterized protein LOC127259394 [Andrographis paniculata]
MPSPVRRNRKGGGESYEKDYKKEKFLSEKATSFHGRGSFTAAAEEMLPRPKTVPELLKGRKAEDMAARTQPAKPAKLLLNVTIQRSTGAVHVLLPPEATAEDLISAALRQYVKEARRPVLPSADASAFDLHYSQFTLECIERKERVIDLGSRNFFLCPKIAVVPSVPGCSKEVGNREAIKNSLPLLKSMNFFLL